MTFTKTKRFSTNLSSLDNYNIFLSFLYIFILNRINTSWRIRLLSNTLIRQHNWLCVVNYYTYLNIYKSIPSKNIKISKIEVQATSKINIYINNKFNTHIKKVKNLLSNTLIRKMAQGISDRSSLYYQTPVKCSKIKTLEFKEYYESNHKLVNELIEKENLNEDSLTIKEIQQLREKAQKISIENYKKRKYAFFNKLNKLVKGNPVIIHRDMIKVSDEFFIWKIMLQFVDEVITNG